MSTRSKMVQALMIAVMAGGGCGSQAQEQRAAPQKKAPVPSADSGIPSGLAGASKPAEAPGTTVPPDKGKEKRGNTPPGKDRAGEGPASGAIVDPAGVIKQ